MKVGRCTQVLLITFTPAIAKPMLYAVLFIRFACKYAGEALGNLFFFQRGQKEGREKLFCSLWFCGGCSGLQMYFFLWCWNSFLIIDAGLRISIYGCSISKCGCAKTNLGQNISKCGCKNTKIGWQFSNLGCENTIADAIFLNADVRILKQDKKILNVDANFLFE